jgi:hypothetical protein
MRSDDDWQTLRGTRPDRREPAISPVRIALLFGTAAVAVALFATSYLADSGRLQVAEAGQPVGLDPLSTGSIRQPRTYIIRRSVLQKSPDSVCIIRPNGSRSGDC